MAGLINNIVDKKLPPVLKNPAPSGGVGLPGFDYTKFNAGTTMTLPSGVERSTPEEIPGDGALPSTRPPERSAPEPSPVGPTYTAPTTLPPIQTGGKEPKPSQLSGPTYTAPSTLPPVQPAGPGPTLGTVNTETDTVSGQLQNILSADNPYITRARASAASAANKRGLLNSSIAAGAGEGAAIDAALPIATADAGTYSAQRLANQSASNVFGLSAQEGAQAQQLAAQKGEIDKQLEALKAAEARGLSAQEAQQQQVLQAQKAEIDKQLSEQAGKQQQALLAQQAEINKEMQALQAKSASELSTQEAKQLQELQKLKGENDYAIAQLSAKTSLQVAGLQAQATVSASGAAVEVQRLRGEQETKMAGLNFENQKILYGIQSANSNLLQTSVSATSMFNSVTGQIATIQQNTNMTAEQRQAAVTQLIQTLNAGFGTIGTIGNVSIPAI